MRENKTWKLNCVKLIEMIVAIITSINISGVLDLFLKMTFPFGNDIFLGGKILSYILLCLLFRRIHFFYFTIINIIQYFLCYIFRRPVKNQLSFTNPYNSVGIF